MMYVDDIMITKNNSKGIVRLKQFLQHQLYTEDLNKLQCFLGLEHVLTYVRGSIYLICQMKRVCRALCPIEVPTNANKKLLKDEGE